MAYPSLVLCSDMNFAHDQWLSLLGSAGGAVGAEVSASALLGADDALRGAGAPGDDALRRFAGYPDGVLLLQNCGVDVNSANSNTNAGVSVRTLRGRDTLQPGRYVEAAARLGPDMVVAMADDAPHHQKDKRYQKAATRTVAWLDQCRAAASGKGLRLLAGIPGFAIRPGAPLDDGLKDVLRDPIWSGFFVGGGGLPAAFSKPADAVRQVAAELRADAPGGGGAAARRLAVNGIEDPVDVVEAVGAGADIVVWRLPLAAAQKGRALTFDVESPADGAAPRAPSINLWDRRHEKSDAPLVRGCGCAACRRHTRAYIHHLLRAHEMLGSQLLCVHNAHHALRLFAALRADEGGAFAQHFAAAYGAED